MSSKTKSSDKNIKNPWYSGIGRRLTYVFGIPALGCLVIIGFYQAGVNHGKASIQVRTPQVIGVKLNQDPTLVADAQELGISYDALNLVLSASPPTGDITPGTATRAAFLAPNTIEIKSGQSKTDELQSVAYEYMHYNWRNLPASEKTQLSERYDTFYQQSPELRSYFTNFVGDSATMHDEENSVACTSLPTYLLVASFNTYCDSVIPNREVVLFPNN